MQWDAKAPAFRCEEKDSSPWQKSRRRRRRSARYLAAAPFIPHFPPLGVFSKYRRGKKNTNRFHEKDEAARGRNPSISKPAPGTKAADIL